MPQSRNGSVTMKDIDKALTVDVRNGLPDELLELLRKFPRDQWANDARLRGLAEGWLQRHNLFRELSVLIGGMMTDLRDSRTSPTTFLPLFQRRMGLLLGWICTIVLRMTTISPPSPPLRQSCKGARHSRQ
jgi:hypothetical protein